MPEASRALAAGEAAFVTGSTLRHVVVMGATGSVGLMAVFAVDLLSLLYVSWLGDPLLTAAVGFATILQVFAVAINIGMMIAVGALVSRALGAGDRAAARRIAASALVLTLAASLIVLAVLLPLLDPLLRLIGAGPDSVPIARRFLLISLPSVPLMALGMGLSGVLRAVADARRAMAVTIGGAAVTALLDPLLIFGLGLGLDGAALSVVAARLAFAGVGWHGAVSVHRMVARPRGRAVLADAPEVLRIALPAVLTNLAPPVASAFQAQVMAGFGTEAVAANTVIERLIPVAFGGLFALSGAVGPILGQNWGAQRFDRMRRILRDCVLVTAVYILAVWLALVLGREAIARSFALDGEAARIVGVFCLVGGGIWLFNGLLFVANAAFNNLGFPLLSTAFNWGRATLGTMPFAVLGAHLGGPEGVIVGVGAGSLIFGAAALIGAVRVVGVLERRPVPAGTGAARVAGAGAAPLPVSDGEVGPDAAPVAGYDLHAH
ncbi:MATE family efflux transporter [Methylobacterium nodulans]|uniref:Multi antimicrobial extrusion protein MatE n=1 Tax=Methylobacterium nodulans (strain LMG 21967 / CNCM I-2342 / ORS 2060) TaxID=460265 RepID=B8ILM9_METNO|nr:MATE family efflux transporter [Methylobacterium nodulans]ACL62004.1 multi antimicrobial extrusion protein MatE [Methylobacterium nodulans ORS 2060]